MKICFDFYYLRFELIDIFQELAVINFLLWIIATQQIEFLLICI